MLLAVFGGLLVATAAPGKTINGTPKNDVLRGTAKADVINGKAGNDKISGLGGNDRLTGGPGADRISCGAGQDVVNADKADTIAEDCETVRGVARAHAGHYIGFTAQGKRIGFDVAGDHVTITGLTLKIDARCGGTFPVLLFNWSIGIAAAASADKDAKFTLNVQETGVSGTLTGSFDMTGGAAGTLELAVDFGTFGPCSSGPVSWTAQPDQLLVLPGQYGGRTDQGKDIALTVSADGKSVTSIDLNFVAPCQPPDGSLSSEITGNGAWSIEPDRTVHIDGRTPDGSTVTVTGTFDPAAGVKGTFVVHSPFDQNGKHYECDTGTVKWSGALR